jgi:ubiquinone/menaquinone biosynthesis C-methylase UbiE
VDVGCGAGRAVAELAERGVHAVGVDPSPWMLAAARERWSEAEFREAGAEDLPFVDGSVRGYCCDRDGPP